MKKIFLVIIGLIVLCITFMNLIAGETSGFGTTAIQGAKISFESKPFEFIFHIAIRIFGAIWAIKVGLSSKPLDD